MSSTDIYFSIWDELLKIQRKSRLLGLLGGLGIGEAGAALGYTDGLVLLILESKPDQTVKDLSETLKLERSWMSRVITDLEDRRLVKSFVPEADKRSKKVRLTRRGEEALEELTNSRRKIMEATLKDLPASAQGELKELSKLLADGLQAPRYMTRSGSHPVDVEFARISWAVGVIGENYMSSGLNVTQYQTLAALSEASDDGVSASELYENLPFDMSTVSRTIAAFEKEGFVEKITSSHDKRSSIIHLKQKGITRWKECQSAATQTMKRALASTSEAKLKKFLSLLSIATQEMPRRDRESLSMRVEVKAVDSPELEEVARKFLKRTLNQERDSKESLNRERFAISVNNNVCGVAELQRSKSSGELQHFVFAGDGISEKECLRLVKNCLRAG